MPKKKKHYKCFWFLPCFLGCWWIASCLGAPLELTGWACKQAEECGKKELYRCREGRCERRCKQAADCNGAATCREGWCIPNFLEIPIASNESPRVETSNESLPTESTESSPNEPLPTEPPPQEAEASPPTEPNPEPNPEIPNELASDCSEDASCPSHWLCQQSRCVPCQRDKDCSTTYGGSCIGGSCEIAARQRDGVLQWSVGTPAVDCASYRSPSAGYRAATQDGVYRIQPPRTTAFDVFCDMTHAGGGWTLLLKSDGSKNTFRYDAPLWNETTAYPAQPDPRNNQIEAKLRSYATVSIKELLFQMLDSNQPTRSLIVRHEGLSLHSILQSPENTPFQTPAGHANWANLVRGGSLQANCRREGINIARESTATNGYITKLRLGILANNENDCGSIDSFTGIGTMYTTTTAPVFAGNANYYVGPNLPTVQEPRWTMIWGRSLP